MKQEIDPRLISFEDAAKLLGGLHPNTIRQRKAGTESLTHVRGLGRLVRLIRAEVDELVDQKISQSIAKARKSSLHAVK